MGHPKYIGQCKLVKFKTIYIESLETGASIPLMTDGVVNVSKILFLYIFYHKSNHIFLGERGHDGRLRQFKA